MGSDGTPLWVGWACVLGAVICFGSFGVPIKSERVQQANVHPFVFQTYKSFWCFSTCWLVLLARPFNFTWWGVVSGLSWVPAGAAYVVGVQHAGLAINQALSSSLVVAISTFWGVVVFHEPLQSIPLATLAFLMLVVGISAMAFFSVPKSASAAEAAEPDASDLRTSLTARRRGASRDGSLAEAPSVNEDSPEDPPLVGESPASVALLLSDGSPHKLGPAAPTKKKNLALGLAASTFNGIWGGYGRTSALAPLDALTPPHPATLAHQTLQIRDGAAQTRREQRRHRLCRQLRRRGGDRHVRYVGPFSPRPAHPAAADPVPPAASHVATRVDCGDRVERWQLLLDLRHRPTRRGHRILLVPR